MALKYIRDNLKSLVWVLWIVILALVGLIFFEWGGFSGRTDAGAQVAATVGSEKITFGELQNQYQNLERQYREAFGEQFNRDLAEQLNLPMQALTQLINQRILLREARQVGLTASDAEVRDTILELPYFQRDGRFIGAEEYQEILRRNRLPVSEFEESIRQQVLLDKLDAVLASTAYVPEAEVEKAYREQVERAKIRFLELPATEMQEVTVERPELADYLAGHAEDFELPEQRTADYLLVDADQLRQGIEISDEAMRAYYDDNQDQYAREEQVRARHILRKVTPDRPKEVARAEIEDARRRIEGGEDFATLAQELSEDEVSARSGGTLRPFGRGEMVPPFEEAAFGAQDGELVGPVETSFGFHLIERLGYTPSGVQPFEQVQASIRARLVTDEANSLAESKALEIAGRVTPEMSADELRALAEQEGLTVETTEPFGRDDTIPGIGRSLSFNQAAFELAAGEVSEPVRIPRGWAVLKLREIREPRLPELDEIADEVREAMVAEHRKAAAAARLAEAVAAGTGLDQLAGELGLEIQEPAEFGRSGSVASLGRHREVIDAALRLEAGDVGGPFTTERGAVVFEVVERKTFDPQEFEQARESTRDAQAQQRLQNLRSSLLEQRRRDLEVRYGAGVLESFGGQAPGRG